MDRSAFSLSHFTLTLGIKGLEIQSVSVRARVGIPNAHCLQAFGDPEGWGGCEGDEAVGGGGNLLGGSGLVDLKNGLGGVPLFIRTGFEKRPPVRGGDDGDIQQGNVQVDCMNERVGIGRDNIDSRLVGPNEVAQTCAKSIGAHAPSQNFHRPVVFQSVIKTG